jgi:hypothetical protein
MPEVASDIVVSGAKVFYSPTGTAAPADTLAVGASWPVGWVYVGYTLEATTINYSFEVMEVMVQQTMAPVRRTRQTEELTLETVLAEHAAPLIALALSGTASATAAGSGQPGKEEVTFGGDYNLPLNQWAVEGSYVDEDGALFPIRIFIHQGTAAEGGSLEYNRESPTGIPLQIKAIADTTKAVGNHLMKIVRILEPASA